MTGKIPTSGPGGLALDTLALAAEPDLVSLRRRTRARAHELRLDSRTVRSLSTAVFEAARALLGSYGQVEAQIGIAEGPSLQVALSAPAASDDSSALEQAIRPLGALVHLKTSHEPGRLGIVLSVSLGVDTIDTAAGVLIPPGTDPVSALAGRLEEQNEALRASQREIQAELQETNRGVVALYAELDDQAEKLRAAEDRLRVLLDSVQDYAICMIDTKGEIQSWNSGAERLFGFSADEIVGREFSCFYTPADRELDVPADELAIAREQGRFEAEGLRVRRGGSVFDAHVLLTVVRGKQGPRGYSLVVRDVTERKRLEDDLRRRAEDLAAANRAKEDFLATLSHELRTPLNAMLGWTRLLRMGKLEGPAMARALETIERNAHIQEQLIADILDVSRIVTGKLRLELRPLELEPIIDAAIDAVRPTADAKGITLASDLSVTGTILGDPDRLQQVVWNLLSNAIKFTPAGGRVDIEVARAGASALIRVSDSGEGITPALLPFVFDRFTQGDGSVTRPHGGLGLGLSIVRHIVELHGGNVQALSDGPGLGATFSVYLPLRAIQEPDVHPEPSADAATLAGVKVLVVDDDDDARKTVATALEQCGAETLAAASTREALRLLPEFRPDVLVSDIVMPGEDGYALIRRVRALGNDGIGGVPAIALTGFAEAEDRRRAQMAGFQRLVAKPVEAEELASVVRTLAEPRVS